MIVLEEYLSLKQLIFIALESDLNRYWADDGFGSSIWRLVQEGKLNEATRRRFDESAVSALQFLIDDGTVRRFEIQSEVFNKTALKFTLTAFKPDFTTETIEIAYEL